MFVGVAASHRDLRPIASTPPPGPLNCCASWFVRGSMRDSGMPGVLIQIDPSPAAIVPDTVVTPALIVSVTFAVFGSMRDTVPSPPLRVHTLPSPAAIAIGAGPTLTVSSTTLL